MSLDKPLNPALRDELVEALLGVPGIEAESARTALFAGMPSSVFNLRRAAAPRADLALIIHQLERVGRVLETGARPLVLLATNALAHVRGTEAGRRLELARRALVAHYGGEPGLTLPDLPLPTTRSEEIPEAVTLGEGRVGHLFMEKALHAAASVARLRVPRIFDGRPSGEVGYGTGWVIAPRLLLTNHHVVDARNPNRGEPPASPRDLAAQGAETIVWFDYRSEAGPHVEIAASELVCADAALDYALLRLRPADGALDRAPLQIVKRKAVLVQGARLNIVQHPGGGPVQYAIRNNFYVEVGTPAHLLRYLTETERGSSGSPVFDEEWRVVALHHASVPVRPQVHRGQTVWVNNEGIEIHAILASMPAGVRAEIAKAQEID